ncbi:hypothetical protein BGZ61DRAFT_459492 [Ilyonectria robusta]|uniref:uncharacterized protein n=1 Tax=Ilyonectria robusta TaxID=1079257 RepID=UPI001E8CE4DB|nr:uncharacterized protein BGZ61DRAFT_459492 [Ilyonectria robusta]KAH8670505.1 hypothetical protein BGZ61DRAFT_459492 [Ilyonectria robusta]
MVPGSAATLVLLSDGQSMIGMASAGERAAWVRPRATLIILQEGLSSFPASRVLTCPPLSRMSVVSVAKSAWHVAGPPSFAFRPMISLTSPPPRMGRSTSKAPHRLDRPLYLSHQDPPLKAMTRSSIARSVAARHDEQVYSLLDRGRGSSGFARACTCTRPNANIADRTYNRVALPAHQPVAELAVRRPGFGLLLTSHYTCTVSGRIAHPKSPLRLLLLLCTDTPALGTAATWQQAARA